MEKQVHPIGRAVARLMEEHGLKAKPLAAKAGLGETYVRDLIRGESQNPKDRELGKLAVALGVDLATLHRLAVSAARDMAVSGIAPFPGEFVDDVDELAILRFWRVLTVEQRAWMLKILDVGPVPMREAI